MFLSDVPNGASFRVVTVALGKEVGKRLADMGFTENTEGAVVRSGFFHGPIQVRIRGYDILIRRSEAKGIAVLPVGDWSAAKDAARWFGGRSVKQVKEMAAVSFAGSKGSLRDE
jgi:ferrous iron transport protein A